MSNQTLLLLAAAGVGAYFLMRDKPVAAAPAGQGNGLTSVAGGRYPSNVPQNPTDSSSWIGPMIVGLADAGASIYKTYETNKSDPAA